MKLNVVHRLEACLTHHYLHQPSMKAELLQAKRQTSPSSPLAVTVPPLFTQPAHVSRSCPSIYREVQTINQHTMSLLLHITTLWEESEIRESKKEKNHQMVGEAKI